MLVIRAEEDHAYDETVGSVTRGNSLHIWSPRDYRDIEIHTGRSQSTVIPRHFHDEIQIGAYQGGSRRLQIGARVLEATRGDLVVVPGGDVHASDGDLSTFQVIYVSPARFAAAARDLGAADRELQPLAGRVPLYRRVVELAHAFADGTPLEQEARFLEVVRGLLRTSSRLIRGRAEPFAIRLAIDYLRAHYTDAVTLDDLAFQVGLNKQYLVHAFRRAVGLPPHAYLIQLRIAQAKSQLMAGRAVAEVAATLGFADQSHFVRTFRRYVGMAPGRYQRSFSSTALPREP
jgi:AraC-like DNA-binding protein